VNLSGCVLTGDLLIIEGNGSLEQIGRVALFNGEVENCVHQNHVIRARPNRECVLPEYLNAFLNSPVGQEEVQKRSRTTSGLRTLSVGKIREIEVPLPPIAQQRCIVQKLRQTEAKIENLLSHLQISQTEIQAVIPSFLHKAFQGHI
jgi:type I restriction enzyme S subunit